MDESVGPPPEPLTKKQRRALRREQKLQMLGQRARQEVTSRVIWKLALGAVIIGLGVWILKSAGAPKPGQPVADLGREHVPSGTPVEYNSNPPTSGPHNAQWEKAGVYDRILPDERLIHSLEHGYIIISYNCLKSPLSNIELRTANLFPAFAHETNEPHEEDNATGSAQPQSLDERSWQDDPDCQQLVNELRDITKQVGLNRLIVVPRTNLDARIALTAWTRIDKMDSVDKKRVVAFIKAFRNKGPEKTME